MGFRFVIQQLNTYCNSGGLPGFEIWSYIDTVIIPLTCNYWDIRLDICCLYSISANVQSPSTSSFNIASSLNYNQNSSCQFLSNPVVFPYVNDTMRFSVEAYNPDCDSLVFAFDSIRNLQYFPPYSYSYPVSNISIDPASGVISVVPDMIGDFIIYVRINEFDRYGNYKGHTSRLFPFIVYSFTNTLPNFNMGAINNLQGNATQLSDFELEMCPGDSVKFQLTFSDPDNADTLSIYSNITSVLPGSVLSYSGVNPVTVYVSIPSDANTSNCNALLTLNVQDQFCPIFGFQSFVYSIKAIPQTQILTELPPVICGNQHLSLTAVGGTQFYWYDTSGNLLIPDSTFSCNPCSQPLVKPNVSTTYFVQSDLISSCSNTDSITVQVVNDFTLSVTADDSSFCLNESTQLHAIVQPPGLYFYQWSNGAELTNDVIADPITALNGALWHTFNVTVTSNMGCVKNGEVSVYSEFTPHPNPLWVCTGTSNYIDLDYTYSGNAQWSSWWSGPSLIDSINGMVDLSNLQPGNYNYLLHAYDSLSTCFYNGSAILHFNLTPNVTIISVSDTVLSGTTVNLMATGATSYNWGNLSGSSINILVYSDTTIMVFGSNVNCYDTAYYTLIVLGNNLVPKPITSVVCYPNPGTGLFTLDTQTLPIQNFEVFDLLGNYVPIDVLETNSTKSSFYLRAGRGTYFIRIKSKNGIYIQKLILL